MITQLCLINRFGINHSQTILQIINSRKQIRNVTWWKKKTLDRTNSLSVYPPTPSKQIHCNRMKIFNRFYATSIAIWCKLTHVITRNSKTIDFSTVDFVQCEPPTTSRTFLKLLYNSLIMLWLGCSLNRTNCKNRTKTAAKWHIRTISQVIIHHTA